MMNGTFHRLMTYIVGFDADEKRKEMRVQLAGSAARNAAVHSTVDSKIQRLNTLNRLLNFIEGGSNE